VLSISDFDCNVFTHHQATAKSELIVLV
jgi:hypothetical protein